MANYTYNPNGWFWTPPAPTVSEPKTPGWSVMRPEDEQSKPKQKTTAKSKKKNKTKSTQQQKPKEEPKKVEQPKEEAIVNADSIDDVYWVDPVQNNASIKRKPEDVIKNNGDYISGRDALYDDLLLIPNWSFEDFYNERTKFRRQGLPGSDVSPYNDRGSFFYKVFFNFNTNYGLLGSLIQSSTAKYGQDINTAYTYLSNNIYGDKFSEKYKQVLLAKQQSLESFGKILNYLQMECPWFFKEVGGLAEVTKRNFNEIVASEDKKISLTFNPDAVDMRISTLLDLYVNACFDTINFKEVIPENLRKFDMSIIIFNPPIANLNVPYQYMSFEEMEKQRQKTKRGAKRTAEEETVMSRYTNNWAGVLTEQMSFKCIILKNCEISLEDLSTTPEVLSTEEPLSLDHSINIKYQRSYIYNLNKPLSIEVLDNMYNELVNTDRDDLNKKIEDALTAEKEYWKEALPDYVEVVEEEVEEEELPTIAEIERAEMERAEMERAEAAIDEIEEYYDDNYEDDEEEAISVFDELSERLNSETTKVFMGEDMVQNLAVRKAVAIGKSEGYDYIGGGTTIKAMYNENTGMYRVYILGIKTSEYLKDKQNN
jgi:hypothetical protein